MLHFWPHYIPLRPEYVKEGYSPPVHKSRLTEQEAVLAALVREGALSQEELQAQVGVMVWCMRGAC